MGLFHPTATCWISSPQGLSPLSTSKHLSARRFPRDVVPALLLPSCLVRARSRLLAFRVCQIAIRCANPVVYAFSALDPLSCFQLPQGFIQKPWPRLHVASAHGLGSLVLMSTRQLTFSVSIDFQLVSPSLDRRPVQASRSPRTSRPKPLRPIRTDSPSSPSGPPNSGVILQSVCHLSGRRNSLESKVRKSPQGVVNLVTAVDNSRMDCLSHDDISVMMKGCAPVDR